MYLNIAKRRDFHVGLARKGKTVCPACGKKSFVNYVDADNIPLADGVCGKCDRLDKCRYHLPPREYYRRINTRLPHIVQPSPERKKGPDFIPSATMLSSLQKYELNPLARFLHRIFDPHIGAEAVEEVLVDYGVGTSKRYGGSTVFWQIDHCNRVRTGKIMGYDDQTGKRIHSQNNWVHCQLKDRSDGYRLEQCFFGAHLVNRSQGAVPPVVMLMESQKAALILALCMKWGGMEGVFIPIAAGGCSMFNPTTEAMRNPYDRHQILRGQKVVLFPDEGKYEEWKLKGMKLRQYCPELYISTVMERKLHATPVECAIEQGDGFDDIILRYLESGREIWNLFLTSYDISLL